jgi:hypothetical protein
LTATAATVTVMFSNFDIYNRYKRLPRPTPQQTCSCVNLASNLERTFVIRIRNNRAEWVNVETGVTNGNVTEDLRRFA